MDILAFSVAEFCSRHNISRSKFYLLIEEGLAPSFFFVGNRRLISVEAAKEWRADMERRVHDQNLCHSLASTIATAKVDSGMPCVTPETHSSKPVEAV